MPRGILEKDVGKTLGNGLCHALPSLGGFYWAIERTHGFPSLRLGNIPTSPGKAPRMQFQLSTL